MIKEICFDMDGTIADLYSVPNWLMYLRNGSAHPYEAARPLGDIKRLRAKLRQLQSRGWIIKVISWTAKNSSRDYDELVAAAKHAWLDVWFGDFSFDEIDIISYGMPKSHYGKGILFDDDETVRKEWGEGAFAPEDMWKILDSI